MQTVDRIETITIVDAVFMQCQVTQKTSPTPRLPTLQHNANYVLGIVLFPAPFDTVFNPFAPQERRPHMPSFHLSILSNIFIFLGPVICKINFSFLPPP
jgi:hypothetical protein